MQHQNGDGAFVSDGFCGHYYQHCQDIVASDVIHSMQEIFSTGGLLQNLNSNLLMLIPNVLEAISMGGGSYTNYLKSNCLLERAVW